MNWIKIEDKTNLRDQLPLDRQFLALWKGSPCIAAYDKELDLFDIVFGPYVGGPLGMTVSRDRENKFIYWSEIIMPEDF